MDSAVHKLHLHPNVLLQPSRTSNHATACNHIDISLHIQRPKCDNSPASTMELQHSPPKSKLTYSSEVSCENTRDIPPNDSTRSLQVCSIDNSRHSKPGGFFLLSLLDHNTPADRSKGFLPAFPSPPRHRHQRALQPCDRHAARRPLSSSTRRLPHSKTHSQPFSELSSKHATHASGFHPSRTHHSQQNPILSIHTFSTGLPVGDLESRITSFTQLSLHHHQLELLVRL